jgi:putative DNA primase/helicase
MLEDNLDNSYPLGEGFEVNQEGVWFLVPINKGTEVQKIFVCAPLYVLAYARDDRNENYSKLLKFFDPDGKEHLWLMPQELLASDGGELRKILLSKGLRLGEEKKSKDLLTRYLLSCDPISRVRTIDRTGWYGQMFIFPEETVGKQTGEKVLYLGPSNTQSIFCTAGTLEDWKNQVSLRCVGNPRLIFSASTSFAAPLLAICHEENGGFHFRGTSSTGKTTALYVAASVFGAKQFIQRWRGTANGLEAVAKIYNDLVLLLDEMGEIHPKDAGEVAYMLGNGTGKARADKLGGARDKAKWRLIFLSTGEISLAQHMMEEKKQAKAGQETRIADIPTDVGKFGLFDDLHEFGDGAAFSTAIKEATREYYGTAGREYIAKLSDNFETIRDAVDAIIDTFVHDNVPKGSSGQVKRVGRRFGLIAAGGELATSYGITGWPVGAALGAAKVCFLDWLESRGSDKDLEEKTILSRLQHFFESHGNSRFSEWNEDADSKTYNRAGFKKWDGAQLHYYVLPEVFRNEICAGLDWKRAGKLALDLGFVMPSTDGKSTRTEMLPGIGKMRCYRFVRIPGIKEEDENS